MSVVMIERPDVDFDAVAHVYAMDGEVVAGVSTPAKIGGALDSYSIGSAWGFRVGYEGAVQLAHEHGAFRAFDVKVKTKDGERVIRVSDMDSMREALKGRGLTPWAKRDRAAERGSNVHDGLEELAQNDVVKPTEDFAEDERGHWESILKWFLHFRPRFVATEVQVASRTHLFAGRYDLRVLIRARLLLPLIDPLRMDPCALRIRELAERDEWALVLADLKTSKRIYPETHYPQLSGYELAGTEMGFPATDCQMVLCTNEDGSFNPTPTMNDYGEMTCDVGISWSQAEDFLGLLEAYRAIKRMKAGNPDTIRERVREETLLAQLPARSAEVVQLALPELEGMTSRSIGGAYGKLAKRGLCQKGERGMWLPPEEG